MRVAPQLRRVELIDEQWAELRKQTLHRRAARPTVQPEDQRRARRVHLLSLDQVVVQEAPRRRAGIRRHVDVARVMARRQRPAPARQRAHLVPYRRASRQRSELRHSQRPERRSRRRSHHSSPGAQPCHAAGSQPRPARGADRAPPRLFAVPLLFCLHAITVPVLYTPVGRWQLLCCVRDFVLGRERRSVSIRLL